MAGCTQTARTHFLKVDIDNTIILVISYAP